MCQNYIVNINKLQVKFDFRLNYFLTQVDFQFPLSPSPRRQKTENQPRLKEIQPEIKLDL